MRRKRRFFGAIFILKKFHLEENEMNFWKAHTETFGHFYHSVFLNGRSAATVCVIVIYKNHPVKTLLFFDNFAFFSFFIL